MKPMKMLLVLLVLAVLLVGCGESEPAADNTAAVHTDAAVSVKETTEETTETTMPAVDVNEALSNVWNIMDNECVEEIPILPGLLLDDIKEWVQSTEFTEIKLEQRTYWDTVRLGTYGDVAVAQISMVKENNFDGEELVWNVRMEKADKLENKTSIVIPEDASISDTWVFDTEENEVPGLYYFWENGDGTCTSMYIIYFEETRNLYTIYTNDVVFTQVNGQWESNSSRSPLVIVNYIKADKTRKYDGPDADEMKAVKSRGEKIVRYFRIKILGNTQTYQYEVGMTMADWVKSEYNTDGWGYNIDEPFVVASADGKYKLSEDAWCWREMTAQVNSSAK